MAAAVKVQFGLVLSRQPIEAWHPERRASARLGRHWRAMFYETRAKLLTELDDISIAHRSYRLRQLERMPERVESMGNLMLLSQMLEQAAKECAND